MNRCSTVKGFIKLRNDDSYLPANSCPDSTIYGWATMVNGHVDPDCIAHLHCELLANGYPNSHTRVMPDYFYTGDIHVYTFS
ncbi:hypothetical protein ES705_39933 [subsurface metagenome]